MKSVGFLFSHRLFVLLCFLLLSFALVTRLQAQTATGSIRGQITDPSGAAVAAATVEVTAPGGQRVTATTGSDGGYALNGLAIGTYTVTVNVAGFAPYQKDSIAVVVGQTVALNVSLSIATQTAEVTVSGQAQALDTASSNNASAVVISGKELDALPDDPDELQSDLQALAGPAAGPNGGQMYIDGFTAGQLPPKSSIREVRINQNPFSAEFDQVGFGRIDILTKPGTNAWHGSTSVNRNQAAFNARNPFASTTGDFQSTQYTGNIGGPLGKKISIFFNADYRDIGNEAVVSALILDSNFNPTPFATLTPQPQHRLNIGPRFDYQLTPTNTLSVRYQYLRNHTENSGVGVLSLPAQGSTTQFTESQLQVVDSQYFGARVVYETRFQYIRDDNSTLAANLIPSLNVPGSFTGGGSGNTIDLQNRYELQSYTSIALVKHFIRFGGRLRVSNESNNSTAAFFGSFQFPSLTAYQIMQQNLAALNAGTTTWAAVRALGGGPNQFSITAGSPLAHTTLIDAGPFIEDDWKARPNVTVSMGLRFETQNHISDHADWAPRIGVAWGLGGKVTAPKYILRAGWGIFYNRFQQQTILQAERLNGVTEQQYLVPNPNFYCGPATPTATTVTGICPSVSSLASLNTATTPTIYQIAPVFHAPYVMQTAVTLEHQLNKAMQLSVIYLNSRAFDQMLIENINSPVLPGTQIPTAPCATPITTNCGVYPNGITENIYRYTSAGRFQQNLVYAQLTVHNKRVTSTFFYILAKSQGTPNGTFVSNSYDIFQDYGRAQFDARNRVVALGTVTLPYGFSLSPLLLVSTGQPFNITIGKDLIGSSIFPVNQRPGIVSLSAKCATMQISNSNGNVGNIYCTKYGTFDAMPNSSEALLPINYFSGPSQVNVNLQLAKTFALSHKLPESTGPAIALPPGVVPPPGPTSLPGRYSLTLSVNARNLFNIVNLQIPIGNLTSPLFGSSNALAGNGPGGSTPANRQVYIQGTFTF